MCKVNINRPLGGPDTTHKLSAGLILPIPLNAELYSLQADSSSLLRLKIKYPDQQTHLIMPSKNHLRLVNLSSGKYNLHKIILNCLFTMCNISFSFFRVILST